jgi:hypothetical protein
MRGARLESWKEIAALCLPKSHSAVFTSVTLLHCAQNLPQYQFAKDTVRTIDSSCCPLFAQQKLQRQVVLAVGLRDPALPAGFRDGQLSRPLEHSVAFMISYGQKSQMH